MGTHGTGDVRPGIMLLHGFMQSHHTWDTVRDALVTRGYDVVAPDFAGHGDAPAPHEASAYTFDALVDALVDVLDSAGLVQANIVGYSMGGRVAELFATAHPERVASLVLESAGIGPSNEEGRDTLIARDKGTAARLRDDGIEVFVDWWEELPIFATQRFLPDEIRAQVRAERLAHDPEALALTVEATGQHAMPDMRRAMNEARFPLLYLAGTDDAKYRAVAEELAAFGGIDVKLIEAGHDIHVENPDAFLRALTGYYDAQGL